MDWQALGLSLELSLWTLVVLMPTGIVAGRWLAWHRPPGKPLIEAALALPLVLPPTVLGYYLLVALGGTSPLGQLYERVLGHPAVFTFDGLLIASILFNLPFAIQPMQRAFEGIPREVRLAASCCGMAPLEVFRRIELPLAWPGVVSAAVLTFAHTLGEFGVVLMVGGSIPGETQTIAIAIYDRVQAFDTGAAGVMSLALLGLSLGAITVSYTATRRIGRDG